MDKADANEEGVNFNEILNTQTEMTANDKVLLLPSEKRAQNSKACKKEREDAVIEKRKELEMPRVFFLPPVET